MKPRNHKALSGEVSYHFVVSRTTYYAPGGEFIATLGDYDLGAKKGCGSTPAEAIVELCEAWGDQLLTFEPPIHPEEIEPGMRYEFDKIDEEAVLKNRRTLKGKGWVDADGKCR